MPPATRHGDERRPIRASRAGRLMLGRHEVDAYFVPGPSAPLLFVGVDSMHRALGLRLRDATLVDLAALLCDRMRRPRLHLTSVDVLPPPTDGWEHAVRCFDVESVVDLLILVREAKALDLLAPGQEEQIGEIAASLLRAFVRRGLRDHEDVLAPFSQPKGAA